MHNTPAVNKQQFSWQCTIERIHIFEHLFKAVRNQIVSIRGVDSNALLVVYGVIQGSTLGHVLFIIYIYYIPKLNLHRILFVFAHETLTFLVAKNWREILRWALEDLFVINKWLVQKRLGFKYFKNQIHANIFWKIIVLLSPRLKRFPK